jgi:tetrapyrrole methylase family protein/MazG family protein
MTEIKRLKEIVQILRSENGCPWDREQTHASLKPECDKTGVGSLSYFLH